MADSKCSDLTTNASPSLDDLLYTVDNPGGTPASRKLTILALAQLLTSSGIGWNAVVAVSDQDVSNNTTVADDNELLFTAVAGAFYDFELTLLYSSPVGAGTPDFKMAFTVPATAVGQWNPLVYLTTADAQGTFVNLALATTGAFGTAAAVRTAIIRGWFTSSAGGSFKLQWAQNTSGANATRRNAGSTLRYRRTV